MSYSNTVDVTLSLRSTQYEIKMSPAGDELWLGIACSFTQWQPPNNHSAYTFGYEVAGTPNDRTDDEHVRAHSWVPYENEWRRFKSTFIRQVIDAFDKKLVLKHTGTTTTQGTSAFPDIKCRFYAWERSQRPHCSSLVVRAASRTTDRMEGRRVRTNFGGPRADCSPFPSIRSIVLEDGSVDNRYGRHNMFLSSNDINLVDTAYGTRQIFAVHEMGHFLGLWHRCEIRDEDLESNLDEASEQMSRPEGTVQPAPPSGQQTQFDGYHPRARYDQSSRTRDSYCGGSTNRGAVTDLMGYGMDINTWHGFAWHDALQRVSRGPTGLDYRQTSWTVERG